MKKRAPRKAVRAAQTTEDRSIPVWLEATTSFYKKLNRTADECGVSRYEALSQGLDALLREVRKKQSPLNKAIKATNQAEAFRKTMGQVSRKYWATLTPEEKHARAQKSARARWNKPSG